jgi:hypothetical protein
MVSHRSLAVLLLLAGLPPPVYAEPPSLTRVENLVAKLDQTPAPDPVSIREDFRKLVAEDPSVLPVLTERIPAAKRFTSMAVLADTVAAAGYRPAAPALVQAMKRYAAPLWALRTQGYDAEASTLAALRSLAGPETVPVLREALFDEHARPEARRRFLEVLMNLDTPEALATIQGFRRSTEDGDGPNPKVELDFASSTPEEEEIAHAVERDLKIFKLTDGEKAPVYRLRRNWVGPDGVEKNAQLMTLGELRYTLFVPYHGYRLTLRPYRGAWIVTERSLAWIA